MKVLFTGLFPRWQCHVVAEANFMEEHLASGDDITVLACDASLKACDANPKRDLPLCLACCGLRESLLSLVGAPVHRLPLIDSERTVSPKASGFPKFRTLEEVRGFHWKDLPVGKEIVSSLVTATGSSEPDMKKHAAVIQALLRDYLAVYLTAVDYLATHGFDKVYIFNGRFVSARAWIRACEKVGVPYVTQERLGMPDRVIRVENDAIHNTMLYADRIKAFWEANKSDEAIVAEAHHFFEERPKGRLTGWYSFVENQDSEKLPGNWSSANRNIVIFSSTESEFKGLPEYFRQGAFLDQQEAYQEIIRETFRRDASIRFYIRVHPNSKGEAIRWWEDPRWREFSNLTVIPPESDVSSYGLLNACEKVIVWLTTIGIEAAYWGKPSIILGRAFYRGIGAGYEPESVAEAVALVLDQTLVPCPREAALAHGAYLRRGVPKLAFSEALGTCKLTFKGKQPNASPEVLRSLWNWENIVSTAPVPDWPKQLWQQWEWFRLSRTLKSKKRSLTARDHK